MGNRPAERAWLANIFFFCAAGVPECVAARQKMSKDTIKEMDDTLAERGPCVGTEEPRRCGRAALGPEVAEWPEGCDDGIDHPFQLSLSCLILKLRLEGGRKGG